MDDGSEDKTREVIESYMVQDKRLRITFVPKEARVRSTKKLALTLAAKAAQYDYLLLTDADCTPESTHWISEMMRGFGPSTEYRVQSTENRETMLFDLAYKNSKGSYITYNPLLCMLTAAEAALSR